MTYCASLIRSCARGAPLRTRLLDILTRKSPFGAKNIMALPRKSLCTAEGSNGVAINDQFTLKLGTFNLLAPCYKVIKTREKRAWWGGNKESSHPELFYPRYEEIFKVLDSVPVFDFLCLQEFWFHNEISELFEKRVGDRYVIYKHKRPTKNDGVALLISRQYIVKDIEYIKFNDIGLRVALLIHAVHSKTQQQILIATTHLTYLASAVDHFTRMVQARKLSQAIDQFITGLDKKDIPLLLCGDFNDSPRGSIYKYFTDLGFVSAYQTFHGNEPEVTHLDHKGLLVPVDYIFYKMPEELECNVLDAFLVPKDKTDKEWPDDYQASDHRLVFAEIAISPKRT